MRKIKQAGLCVSVVGVFVMLFITFIVAATGSGHRHEEIMYDIRGNYELSREYRKKSENCTYAAMAAFVGACGCLIIAGNLSGPDEDL